MAGSAPSAVELTNSGAVPVSWSATVNGAWLAVTPPAGTLPAGQTAIVSLAPSVEGLADGQHGASVTISAPGAAGSPQVVTATLLIGPPAAPGELVIAEQVSGYQSLGVTSANASVAQTFVAPSGSISGIAVALSRSGNPAHAVRAAIRRTLNGPDLAIVQLAGVVSVDYRAPSSMAGTFTSPVAVVPGEIYLLVLSVPAADSASHYRWSVDTSNPYPGGIGGRTAREGPICVLSSPGTRRCRRTA